MTSAAVLTVAVSMALVGVALLLRQGVQNATVQWRGGVELNIFLKPDVSQAETDAVRHQLESMPSVKEIRYVGKNEAFKEYQSLFANEPEFRDVVTAEDLPPSFRVVPKSPELTSGIGSQFEGRPGVFKVAYAEKEIKTLLKVTRALQIGIFVVAVVLLLSASTLILNTIRMAIYSRRREVAVMKLVGATNWFIRVPFMLEGFIHGVTGALVAFGLTYGLRNWIASFLPDQTILGTNSLFVTPTEAIFTGVVLLVVGIGVGVLGSAFAVRRYLAV